MHEMEQKVWEQHDRRLNEHELRFNQGTRDFTEIKDALRQITERINEGVSKTQQRILEENKTLEMAMRDLKHAVELNTEKMNNKIDTVDDALKKRLQPIEDWKEKFSNIYMWGIISGVIIGMVAFGVKETASWALTRKRSLDNVQDTIATLKAMPMRRQ